MSARNLLINILGIVWLGLVVTWFVFVPWIEHVAFSSPLAPNAATGQVAPFTYKSVVHYVERWQAPVLTWGAPVLWLSTLGLGIALHYWRGLHWREGVKADPDIDVLKRGDPQLEMAREPSTSPIPGNPATLVIGLVFVLLAIWWLLHSASRFK